MTKPLSSVADDTHSVGFGVLEFSLGCDQTFSDWLLVDAAAVHLKRTLVSFSAKTVTQQMLSRVIISSFLIFISEIYVCY